VLSLEKWPPGCQHVLTTLFPPKSRSGARGELIFLPHAAAPAESVSAFTHISRRGGGYSDFAIFLEIQYASCVFGLVYKQAVFLNIEWYLSYLTF
jgi:hypothetical protein